MPQVAEIRLSNIFLFRLRRFRVPKLMKQVLVLTLQILFSSHQHRRLLIYFISFFLFWRTWHWTKWTGWSPAAASLDRRSGTVGVACRVCCFGHFSNSGKFAFRTQVPRSWLAPKKNVRFLFYAVMSACHIILYWALKCGNWRENIMFQNFTVVVYTIPNV